MTMLWKRVSTPLGEAILGARDGGLAGVWFEGQRHFAGIGASWREASSEPLLVEAARQLGEWFEGGRRVFELPLAPVGTEFQRAVWREIAGVGFGRTETYGRVAARLGLPKGGRAVGAATGRNPLSIVVPCHRMIGGDGELHGFAGGLDRKRALLDFEAGLFRFGTAAPGPEFIQPAGIVVEQSQQMTHREADLLGT